jgi:cyclophilin family peptidyl-prolyl cis-trans isomerase
MNVLANTSLKKQITRNRSVLLATLLVAWVPGVACSAAPAAPSGLAVTAPVLGELELTWVDNATDEDSYRVDVRVPPSIGWGSISTVFSADSTSASLVGGSPGTTYEFRTVAVNSDGETPSNVASVTTLDVITNSSSFAHIEIGQPFSFFVTASNGSNSTVTYSASPLPAGLSIDSLSGEISGTPTTDGYTSVTIEASYSSPTSPSVSSKLALRIRPALSSPVLNTALPVTPLIALSAVLNIPLNSHFTDPDTSVAVSIDTTQGSMVFSLFDRAMPDPVTNFLSYVDGNSYSNNVFHRSVNESSFDIIQSGGFFGDGNGVTSVVTSAPIENAPGIPNERGTLAYARTNDPDSATSGWYINAQDSPGLDGGDSYAVFGRATTASLSVIDTIFNFTTGTHPIPINGAPGSFTGFPTIDGNVPSAAPNNLIIVNEIVRVPVLTYVIDSNSSPAIASASIVDLGTGPELQITPLLPGETAIQLTVTDIDGNDLTSTHNVTVQAPYSSWIASLVTAPSPAGPTDNSAGGSFNNLQSYAFGGDHNDASDDELRSPIPAVTHNPYDLSFYYRKYASDLIYTVQYSSDLNIWDTVWTSADGIDAGNVINTENDGDFLKLTVRKTYLQTPTQLFSRVIVTLLEP